MFKKIATLFASTALVISLAACSAAQTQETTAEVESQDVTDTDSQESESTENSENTSEETSEESEEISTDAETEENTESSEETATDTSASELGTVLNTIAEDEETLIATYADSFEQLTYTDEETGLSITYNLYLPEGYDESEEYPMVVFIADSSCAGTDATTSLTQGRGALVWATDEWQEATPTIVAVPTYPETILDDHGSYTTTEYVELTKSFIDYMTEEYSVDTERIYGTGQSMGCMTTLILASEYPDLYAACMFVDGQWDISTLSGLEGQTFVYFAAEDDTNAWEGMQEVMAMYDEDGVDYTYIQWDGTWSTDELSEAAVSLFSGESTGAYFISWATGTIDASTASSSGMGGMSMGAPSDMSSEDGSNTSGFAGPPSSDSSSEDMSGEMPEGMSGEAPEGMSGEMPEGMSGEAPEGMSAGGGMNSSSYHMASFDYAYNCVAVMEWLFQQ
ncbi:MAG: prolyl oligopeptidase family serine peptidase [Butyrivibrio sp.]|nr:prolyl oligopeptidase family serine peptidase [Butyrivibrio sp.]